MPGFGEEAAAGIAAMSRKAQDIQQQREMEKLTGDQIVRDSETDEGKAVKSAVYKGIKDALELAQKNKLDADSSDHVSNDSADEALSSSEKEDEAFDTSGLSMDRDTFYLSNGIPFSMFMKILENRIKQAVNNAELQKFTSLSFGGIDQNDDGTYSADADGGLIDKLAAAFKDQGVQDSMKTMMQGAQSLAQATGAITEMVTQAAMSSSKPTAEQATVDTLENASKAIDHIAGPQNEMSSADLAGAHPEVHEALTALKRGNIFTEGDQHFGSKKVGKGFKSRAPLDPVLDKSDLESQTFVYGKKADGTPKKMTFKDALEKAGPEARAKIKDRIQKELDTAKDDLKAKERQISDRAQRMGQVLNTVFNGAGAGTTTMMQQQYIQQAAAAQATQQELSSSRDGINKVQDNQAQSIQTDKQAAKEAIDTLNAAIRTANQRG